MSTLQLLLVEDNEELRAAMAETLADHGYEVLEAANGNEAIVIARTNAPSIILLDLMMPVMDGWEFLRQRSHDEALSTIPVIVLTAQHPRDFPADASVLRVLRKPPEIDKLIAIIDQACPRTP